MVFCGLPFVPETSQTENLLFFFFFTGLEGEKVDNNCIQFLGFLGVSFIFMVSCNIRTDQAAAGQSQQK